MLQHRELLVGLVRLYILPDAGERAICPQRLIEAGERFREILAKL